MKKEDKEKAFQGAGYTLIFAGISFILTVDRNKYLWMATGLAILLGIALIYFRKKL